MKSMCSAKQLQETHDLIYYLEKINKNKNTILLE